MIIMLIISCIITTNSLMFVTVVFIIIFTFVIGAIYIFIINIYIKITAIINFIIITNSSFSISINIVIIPIITTVTVINTIKSKAKHEKSNYLHIIFIIFGNNQTLPFNTSDTYLNEYFLNVKYFSLAVKSSLFNKFITS